MDQPLITIGITCFNAQDTIERAIHSALAQEWSLLEIIIVDDASSDRSVDIVERFLSLDNRIRLIRHETNKGFPSALNTIITAANGQFICFFDDDDESRPERIKMQWAKMLTYEQQKNPKLTLCFCNRNIARVGALKADSVALAIGRQPPEPHGEEVADFILWRARHQDFTWGMFGTCTLLVRRSFFDEIGLFDPAFRRCAEWDLEVRAALQGAHFIAVDVPLITQYKTLSADKAGKTPLLYSLKLRRKYRAYLKENRVYAAALFHARSVFYHDRGRIFRGKLFLALSWVAAPAYLLRRIFQPDRI